MTVKSLCPVAKLIHVGGFGSHLNTEITSHVHKQSGWIGLGRQELWTDPEHCKSYLLVETSFQAIHHISTAALDTSA